MYDPGLGRFLQTDPAGYASDINAYAYAGNDPVNSYDPSGMDAIPVPSFPDISNSPPDSGTPVNGVDVNSQTNTSTSGVQGNELNSSLASTPVAELVVTGKKIVTTSVIILLPQSTTVAGVTVTAHTQCPGGTSANTSGPPDYSGGATEYGVNPDGSPTHFAGRPTASGAIFDPWGFTAATIAGAHGRFTIPKNSYVDVVSVPDPTANVVVKITDTGNLGPGDVIDLSAAAMQQLTGKAYNSVPVNIFMCR